MEHSSKYEDIIHLPHHVSSTHPQMPITDRAAQFSPFAALTGHDAAIKETARLTEQRIELDENSKSIINEKIQMIVERLRNHPTVSIIYFRPDNKKEGGSYVTASGIVKKIDEYHRHIIMADGHVIPIDEIFDISEELEALRRFILKDDVDVIYQVVDYETIGEAIKDMLPGYYGYYFMNHFMPYLQIKIKTPEQEQAYKNIIRFWDNADIKLPLMMKIIGWINFYLMPKESMQVMADRADEQIKRYIQMSEDDYEKFKKEIASSAKIKNSFFFKYHPAFISQRKFMKQLQDKGYNDIFIPNMKALSPKYKEYHDALMRANDRVCADLGLYYDSNYNLVVKQ